MKIRLNSYKSDNQNFIKILKLLEKANVVRLLNVSEPYANRGSTILERVYIDLEINPELGEKIVNNKEIEVKTWG